MKTGRFIRLGSLEISLAKGAPSFGLYRTGCGCLFAELGPLGLTWLSKDCRRADKDLAE